MELKNLARSRKDGIRYYTATICYKEKKSRLKIVEQYESAGVDYKVFIDGEPVPRFGRKKKTLLHTFSPEQWYELYFIFSNKQYDEKKIIHLL